MSGVAYQHPLPGPCPRCTGYGDAHYLTCPTLRLPVPEEDTLRRVHLVPADDDEDDWWEFRGRW